jgi:hypothetical protein
MAAARTALRSLPDILQTAADRVMPVLRSLATRQSRGKYAVMHSRVTAGCQPALVTPAA